EDYVDVHGAAHRLLLGRRLRVGRNLHEVAVGEWSGDERTPRILYVDCWIRIAVVLSQELEEPVRVGAVLLFAGDIFAPWIRSRPSVYQRRIGVRDQDLHAADIEIRRLRIRRDMRASGVKEV